MNVCKKGHLLTPDNVEVIVTKTHRRFRFCLTCKKARLNRTRKSFVRKRKELCKNGHVFTQRTTRWRSGLKNGRVYRWKVCRRCERTSKCRLRRHPLIPGNIRIMITGTGRAYRMCLSCEKMRKEDS